MKRKQRLQMPREGISTRSPSLNKCKQNTNECEIPTDEEIPCGFASPTSEGTGPDVSISVTVDQLSDQPSQGKRTRKHHKINEQDSSMSSAQRKKGRPSKLQVKGPQSPAQGKEGNEVGNASESNETILPIIIELECIPPSGTTMPQNSYGKECSDPTGDQKQNLSKPAIDVIKEKRGRPPKTLASTPHASPDAADTSGGKNAECIAIEKVVAEVPRNGLEDQPLSKWFEEMHPPTAVDGSRLTVVKNVEQHSEASEKSKEIVVPNPAIGNGEVTTSSDLQSLPFVKSTLLWATIESMDVFRKIPQKPHFRPLEHSKDSSREGLAISYMVTFSSVVDKACRLEFDAPRSSIDEMLDTLCDLESHGFDVMPVRARLNEMLLFKCKQENLEGLLAKTNSEMGKHNMDKAKIDEEVDDIKKQIAELEKKLSQTVSSKEAKEDEIASLQSRMDEISEEIRNLRQNFEALTCKPF